MATHDIDPRHDEQRIDAYLEDRLPVGALDNATHLLLQGLEALHTARPREDFCTNLALSLRLRAEVRGGSPRWFAIKLEEWLQSPGGPLRVLAGAAALVLLGILIGIVLPLEVTARPAASQSRLAQFVPIRPGWDDLARIPGPGLFNWAAPYKPLLREPAAESRNGATLTVTEIALVFGERGTPVQHERSVDGGEVAVFSRMVVVLEVENETGGPLTWDSRDLSTSVVVRSADGVSLTAISGPIQEGHWNELGLAATLPQGHSTWAVQLERRGLPRRRGEVVQVDALPWHTPSLAVAVGLFGDGSKSWRYELQSVPLDWTKPIVDPDLRQWKGVPQR